MRCEVCGKEAEKTFRVKMEGSVVTVCPSCKDLGDEPDLGKTPSSTSSESSSSSTAGARPTPKPKKKRRRGSGSSVFDDVEEIVDDYAERIREGREARDLTQKELAAKIGEKRSLLRHLEKGDKLPSDDVAEKLERVLDIELTASTGEVDFEPEAEGGGLSLGDVVDIKRKK